jgi:hypothetical protein
VEAIAILILKFRSSNPEPRYTVTLKKVSGSKTEESKINPIYKNFHNKNHPPDMKGVDFLE